MTLKGISEASALRHIAKEVVCSAPVDREQLASLGGDLLRAARALWQGREQAAAVEGQPQCGQKTGDFTFKRKT